MHKINTCIAKITFVFVLLMGCARLAWGQGNPVPPSPNASALLEYANVPVNYYNGLPSIDVPLYDLPGRQLSVSISLSYHASGIKVQDVASSYGLGWNLNAGGAITRVVRGLPDHWINGFGNNVTADPAVVGATDIFEAHWKMTIDLLDGQPDIFYFNFMGRTGSFVLDYDGDPVLIPYQNLEIKPAIGPKGIGHWEIIDENGTKFTFGDTPASVEKTSKNTMDEFEIYNTNNEYEFESTWYLSKARSAFNDEVTFTYSPGAQMEYYYYSEIIETTDEFVDACYHPENRNTRIRILTPKYLNEITTSQGKIKFTFLGTGTQRQDLTNGKYLDKVEIKDLSSQIVKSYFFEYDYFDANLSIPLRPNCNDQECRRLKLVAIRENLRTNPINFRHFKYNNNRHLPPRHETFLDHWGYFNYSGLFNDPICGDVTVWRMPAINDGNISTSGLSKSPNYESAQANILTEIELPTGGSTKFEYEGNVIGGKAYGGIRIRKITAHDGVDINKDIVRTFNYLEGNGLSNPLYYISTKTQQSGPNYGFFSLFVNEYTINTNTVIYSDSYVPLFDLNGQSVGYTKVSETFTNGSRIEYQYTGFKIDNNGLDHSDEEPEKAYFTKHPGGSYNRITSGSYLHDEPYTFTPNTSRAFERGLLESQTVYDNSNKVISRVTNEYDFGQPVKREVRGYTSRFYPGFLSLSGNVDLYATGIYKYISKPVFLKKSTTETYDQDFPGDNNKKMVLVSEYRFDPDHLQLKEVKSYNPQETEEYIREFKYVTDFDLSDFCNSEYIRCRRGCPPLGGNCLDACRDARDACNNQANLNDNLAAMQSMIDLHMVNQIVETQQWIIDNNGTQLVNATLTKFKKEGTGSTAMYLPATVRTLNDMRKSADYTSAHINVIGQFVFESDMRLTRTYLDYDDNYGSLLKEKGRDEIVTKYNWDATKSLLTSTIFDEGSGGKNFTTTYTYKNLVGIETITDPNGLTTTFEYDTYNRLKLVRDHDNKIVANYEYNYDGENGSNYNYVKSESMLVGSTSLGSLSNNDKNATIDYFDGLGRPIQTAYLGASPSTYNSNNVIQFYEYDNQGLQKKSYLPYMATSNVTAVNSVFRANALSEQANFYNDGQNDVVVDLRPFVESEFENTPLNRVLNSFGPGKLWKDNNRKVAARQKVAAGNTFRKWTIVDGMPVSVAEYPSNSLVYIESTDEENRKVRDYSDSRGLTILREVQESASTWLQTYYVYDSYGNLRFIIPPEASANLSGTTENGQDPVEYVDTNITLPPSNFNHYVYNSPGSITLAPGFEHNAATNGGFSITVGITPVYAQEAYMYQFQYDDEQRLISQKDPGADWVFYVYDKWDRLVMSQDGLQRAKTTKEWTFIKYDRLNRAVMTGIYESNASHSTMISNVKASNNRYESTTNSATGYTLTTSYPTAINAGDLLTVNYFDDYGFTGNASWDAENSETAYNFSNPTGYSNTKQTLVKGLPTGSKTKILGSSNWLNSVVYYDDDYQVIQIYSENHKGGIDKITNQFTFSGRMSKSTYTHKTTTEDIDLLKEYEYDHAGRITKGYLTVENNPRILLASIKYNEIGQLIEKNLHSNDNGTSFLQSVDLQYNIRGWLTHINNSALSDDGSDGMAQTDLFGMELIYNQSTININGTNTTRQYNGNLSAIKWQTNNLADDAVEKIYGYTYDYLNQMKTAKYATKTGVTWTGNAGHYDVDNLTYDKNGNIESLNRYAGIGGSRSKIDGLTYSYGSTNQLKSVEDNGIDKGFKNGIVTATEYSYDENGNMKYDLNKGVIDVKYNYLNLPEEVELDNNKKVQYTYDAAGNKLKKKVLEGSTVVRETDYVGVAQYEDNNLSFLWTEEGRVIKNGSDYEYEYYLTDHQGNTRLTFGYMKEVDVYEATMETENNTKESADFIKLSTRASNATYNITPDHEVNGTANEAARLNGSTGNAIGPGKAFAVSAGDKVDLSVFARYSSPTSNSSAVINNLVAAVTSAFSIVNGGETQTLYQSFDSNLPSLSSGIASSGTQVPKAYINYLIFDSNDVFQQFGYQQITSNANNAHEQLTLTNINVPVNGTMYVYVANESSENVDVWFDDITIIHKKNTWGLQVTNSADYYPFGGQIQALSYQKSTSIANAYGYQGLYAELDDNTGWHGFELRQYDAFLGRWMSMDPYGQYASPYLGMGNSPVNGVDPDGGLFGLNPVLSTFASIGIGMTAGAFIGSEISDRGEDRDRMLYGAVGGLIGGLIGGFGPGLAENLPDLSKVLSSANKVLSVVGEVGELYASSRNGIEFLESIGKGDNNQPNREIQQNPLMRHAAEAISLDEWLELNSGLTQDEIINQQPASNGFPGGPTARYVFDPLNPNAVIDMRHMLIVGKLGPVLGNANELLQLKTDPSSALDPQDFYSNKLGYRFYKYSEGKGAMGWIINNLISSPNRYTNRLGSFLKNSAYRGNNIFIDR